MHRRELRTLIPLALTVLIVTIGVITWPSVRHIPSPAEPTRVYFADHISPAHQLAIEEFNREHRGRIEVIPVDLPFDKFSTNERKELLARSLRSKSDKVDVFAVDVIWVPRFARWAEPLDSAFPREQRSGLLSYALRSCIVDGRMLAAPMYIDIGMMYYRRDIIERLPDGAAVEQRIQSSLTWDEMTTLRRRLGYGHRPFYIFQAKDYEGLVCNLLELAVGRDPRYLTGHTLPVTAQPMQDALGMLVHFVRTGFSPQNVVECDENLSYTVMLDDNALFVRGWPNFIENFRRFYPDTVKLNAIGRAPLPHFAGEPPTSVFGGWDLMVSKSSSKKEEAKEFIRFLQSPRIQRLMFENGGYIPILNSVYADSAYLSAHTELRFYRTLVDRGFHRPAFVDYTKASDILSYFARRAITGELPVRDALKKADAMIRADEVLIK